MNTVLKNLTNEFLIEVYIDAIKLNLSKDFIELLEAELKRRGLEY